MPDYKESQVAGKKWQRCYRIDLQNNAGAMPCAIFFEEERFIVGDETLSRNVGQMQVNFDQPLKAFPLLNPADDTVIGQAQHQDVYVLLYSLYRAIADERDNPPPAPPSEENPPAEEPV